MNMDYMNEGLYLDKKASKMLKKKFDLDREIKSDHFSFFMFKFPSKGYKYYTDMYRLKMADIAAILQTSDLNVVRYIHSMIHDRSILNHLNRDGMVIKVYGFHDKIKGWITVAQRPDTLYSELTINGYIGDGAFSKKFNEHQLKLRLKEQLADAIEKRGYNIDKDNDNDSTITSSDSENSENIIKGVIDDNEVSLSSLEEKTCFIYKDQLFLYFRKGSSTSYSLQTPGLTLSKFLKDMGEQITNMNDIKVRVVKF